MNDLTELAEQIEKFASLAARAVTEIRYKWRRQFFTGVPRGLLLPAPTLYY